MSDQKKIPALLRGAAQETTAPEPSPAALLRPKPDTENWHKEQLGAGLRAVYQALVPFKLSTTKHAAQFAPDKVVAMSLSQVQREALNTRAAISLLTENGKLPADFRTDAPCRQLDTAYDGLQAFEQTKWAHYEAYRGTPGPGAFTPYRATLDLTEH